MGLKEAEGGEEAGRGDQSGKEKEQRERRIRPGTLMHAGQTGHRGSSLEGLRRSSRLNQGAGKKEEILTGGTSEGLGKSQLRGQEGKERPRRSWGGIMDEADEEGNSDGNHTPLSSGSQERNTLSVDTRKGTKIVEVNDNAQEGNTLQPGNITAANEAQFTNLTGYTNPRVNSQELSQKYTQKPHAGNINILHRGAGNTSYKPKNAQLRDNAKNALDLLLSKVKADDGYDRLFTLL